MTSLRLPAIVAVLIAGSAPATATAQAAFSCPVVRVHDGDTFTCADGVRVRLKAIDAPEIGPCRGHGGRCVPGDGFASREALRRLALGRTATCRGFGRSYDRVVALCSVGSLDLSCAQRRAGFAIERYGRLRCR